MKEGAGLGWVLSTVHSKGQGKIDREEVNTLGKLAAGAKIQVRRYLVHKKDQSWSEVGAAVKGKQASRDR